MSDADRTTALADALLEQVREGASERADAGTQAGQNAERAPRVVEVAIGNRTAVATALVDRGAIVLATDVVERTVSEPIGFRRDDLHDPERSLYCGADLLYALRLPPELHGAFARLAADLEVPATFTTLGGDSPAVPATPEQLSGGETLHWLDANQGH